MTALASNDRNLNKLKKYTKDKTQSPFMDLIEVRRALKSDDLDVLYIMNLSDKGGTRIKGEIFFSVLNDMGDPKNIPIPNTFVPIEMSSYANIETIVRSQDFAQLLNSGAIAVVRPEVVKAIFDAEPDWADESRRIAGMPIGSASLAPSAPTEELKVQPAVLAIMENEGMNDREKLLQLTNMVNTIDIDSLKYILSNAESDSLKRFATEILNEKEE